jgi:hypothetical protein
MSTINVGKLSEIKSSVVLKRKLEQIKSGIKMAVSQLEKTAVVVPQEYLFTFRMGHKIFTVVPNTEELSKGTFDLGQQLKKLELADFQKVNLLVEIESVSLADRLNSMKSDVLTIKGSDVRFRAKHIIKPAQPGQEHLNAWSNLTDVVSIVVTRLPENPEVRVQAELAHLKDVIENSSIFAVDKDENLLINL